MRGVALITVGALVLVVAAVLGPAAIAGQAEDGRRANGISRADLVGVNFIENCRFSHQAPDDPIVFPGKPGASHQHTFVGNRTTNAFSNFGSLRSGATTCMRADDTAAYWVPTLYQGTTGRCFPQGATIYYRRGTLAEVSPFPNNLRMIAGDAAATSPQGMRVTFWSCGVVSGADRSATVPTCPDTRGSFLRLHIRFPECWDGTEPRQRGPQEPHGVRNACRLPLDAPRRGAADHADLPLSDPSAARASRSPRAGSSAPCGLRERLEAGRASQARGRLPERARPLRARLRTARGGRRIPRPPRRSQRRFTPRSQTRRYGRRVSSRRPARSRHPARARPRRVAAAARRFAAAATEHAPGAVARAREDRGALAGADVATACTSPAPRPSVARFALSSTPRPTGSGLRPSSPRSSSPCADYYVSVPPLVADKTQFRRDQAIAHPRARPELPRTGGDPLHDVEPLGHEHRLVLAHGRRDGTPAHGRSGLRRLARRQLGAERAHLGSQARRRQRTHERSGVPPRSVRRRRLAADERCSPRHRLRTADGRRQPSTRTRCSPGSRTRPSGRT